ncbi:NADH-quinone oxidoreductase subunit NuoH [Singulisphaera rosea]
MSALIVLVGIMIKILLVVGITQGAVAYLILVERKVAAYSQDRIGPNRCGRDFGLPMALLQPLADGAKMLLKEDMVPGYVDKPLYILAPMIAIIAATISFAVVPFGVVGPNGPDLYNGPIQFQIAPGIDVGIVYIFAIGSLGVYSIILAGWSSNSKYAFIGGLRSSAQLISYEIPMGMSILGIVLLTKSLDLNTIINWQDTNHVWGIVVQPLGFLLFLISAFAETNRLPFDLPESEQELVAGFHTEYSAMKFGMFFLGEYLNIITTSYLIVILFLGGWDVPFLTDQHQTGLLWAFVKMGAMMAKVGFLIFFIMWIRWTIPRFRYDQLMDLAWKSMIPLSIVNLVATAGIVQLLWGWGK